jgi:hypothetical protein
MWYRNALPRGACLRMKPLYEIYSSYACLQPILIFTHGTPAIEPREGRTFQEREGLPRESEGAGCRGYRT